jgi:hypothetical protein
MESVRRPAFHEAKLYQSFCAFAWDYFITIVKIDNAGA